MAGYTRQSTGQIINGSPITAPPLNSEFNQVAAAFNATTGHGHTGGVGDSPKINLATSVVGILPTANGGSGGKNNFAATAAPSVTNDTTQGYQPGSLWENINDGRVYVCVGSSTGAAVWRELVTVFTNNKIEPAAHNTIDLGTPTVRFQDLYLQGGISAVGNVAIGGTLNTTALSTLNSLTVTNASTMNSIAASGNVTVGGTLTPTQIDVNAGTIDGAVIGGSSAQAVTGTVVTATTNFAGDLTGNVTGNLTGNVTGNVTGDITGDVTGNVTAASGTSSFNNLTVNGTLNMNAGTSATIENLSAPVNANDAARKIDVDNAVAGLVDSAPDSLNTLNELAAALADDDDAFNTLNTAIGTKLPKAGGTMTGSIAMSTNKITGAGDPTAAQDVSTKAYTDAQRDTRLPLAGGTMTGGINMGANKVTATYTPSASADLTTKTYVDGILGSGTSAATAAANAATSETNAATSASAAASSATAAATSETNAATSETNALASKTAANTSATNAASSASAASTSATNAATSETNASTSATNAGNSATAANTSATNAATSETNAASSATAANTSATNAATSETNAASSATAAAASYDNFDDRYLGAKSSAPSTDNDGDALVTGALYWNSTSNGMYAWTGSAWALTTNYNDAAVDTHLNTGTAASGEFLSWNGSDYDWAAVASGADLYAANESSPTAQPSATGTNAIAIGDSTTSSGTSSVAIGFGADASNTHNVAIGYNSEASTGTYNFAFGSGAIANAPYYAVAIGQTAGGIGAVAGAPGSFATSGGVTATGNGAQAIGSSYASGNTSFAATIQNRTSSYGATDANTIAVGYQAKANAAYATSIGYNNTASGIGAAVLGATSSTSSGFRSLVVGGLSNTASGSYASVLGGQSNTASEAHAIAMGDGSTASHANSVSIGDSVQSTATNQINLGGTADTVRISETYTLPTSDGTNGQVLTTNGSGVVTFADAGGGGGADLFAENYDGTSTLPSATGTNAVAIGRGTASGSDAVALGDYRAIASGSRSFAVGNSLASGASSTALNIGMNNSGFGATNIGAFAAMAQTKASGFYSLAMGYGAVASNSHSVGIGYNANSTGSQTVALSNSYASGTNSFAAAIASNSSSYGATGANSIAMGQNAKATASQAFTVNGYAQGTRSIAIGASSHATSTDGCAIGYDTTAVGSALALGTQANAQAGYSVAIHRGKAEQRGKIAFSGGIFATQGDAQGGQFVLLADTTDATATVLTSNNGSASTDNQIVAASDTCITFDGTITAMQNGAQAYASWKIEGLLVNDGGTTTLANSATTVISNGSSWGMALSADNTNNALAITCTGEASHNIRWVANIRTTEVTYA